MFHVLPPIFLSPISTAKLAKRERGDRSGRAKTRSFRLFLGLRGKTGQPADWLVGEAVLIAPFSAQTPANREFYRGFRGRDSSRFG